MLFSIYSIQNLRIDASSDTLIAQNDSDFEYFNNYWYVRPIGFSIATITFGTLAWFVLDEIPDTKTIISLFLSIIIVILQLSK